MTLIAKAIADRRSAIKRLQAEIRSEAARFATDHDMDPDTLVSLAMAIVDLEDQDRIKRIHNIRQRIDEKLLAAAVSQVRNEES